MTMIINRVVEHLHMVGHLNQWNQVRDRPKVSRGDFFHRDGMTAFHPSSHHTGGVDSRTFGGNKICSHKISSMLSLGSEVELIFGRENCLEGEVTPLSYSN